MKQAVHRKTGVSGAKKAITPASDLLMRMAYRYEQAEKKEPVVKRKRGNGQRLTDEQVTELRLAYDGGTAIKDFISAHPDWPWPPKEARQWAQKVATWIYRTKRSDGTSWR